MQYILKISDYGGLVAGASHFRGRVEGERPKSCHGAHHYDGGKETCDQGHELPGQVSWEVEAHWTEEHFERYMAAGQPGDSPSQFTSKKDVMDRAIIVFLDGCDDWWAQKVEPAEEGDELWYGWVCPDGDAMSADLQDPEDSWGMRIARCQRG